MLELLSFGDQGWGDEMLLAGLMTILVSLSSVCLGLLIGVILASFKLSKYISIIDSGASILELSIK